MDSGLGCGYRIYWGVMPQGGATVEATGVKASTDIGANISRHHSMTAENSGRSPVIFAISGKEVS